MSQSLVPLQKQESQWVTTEIGLARMVNLAPSPFSVSAECCHPIALQKEQGDKALLAVVVILGEW